MGVGKLVELLQDFHRLPKGTVGIVSRGSQAGWVAVFGGASITLPFADEGRVYQFCVKGGT